MAGFTNRGKYLLLEELFRNPTEVTNFYVILFTSATAPTADSNTVADHTQIATGNGYTDGGYSLTRNSTDFDVLTEDDTADVGFIQIKDVVWTATTGSLPSAGGGARYAALTTDEATVSTRQIICWWDLVSDRSVSVGQTLTLQNCELRLTE